MEKDSLRQYQGHAMMLALSLTQQEKIRRLWEKRNVDPLAYALSSRIKEGVTVTEADGEQTKYGDFAVDYVREVLKERTGPTDRDRRIAEGKMFVSVGFGKGHDAGFLPYAVEAGYKVVFIDVSDKACSRAHRYIDAQWEELVLQGAPESLRPRVIRREIHSFLAEPAESFDLEQVEMWYFGRLLGLLSKASFKAVLQAIGWWSFSSTNDPRKKKTVVVLNAMKEDNPNVVSVTSKLNTKKSLANNLLEGAGRPLWMFKERQHPYFGVKLISALTFKAAD